MKICAACHTDLPKDNYSKKQWKLDEYQRRCKVCVNNNRDVQVQPPPQQNNNDTNKDEIIRLLDSMYLEDVEKISDEELFKEPPAKDCPICFQRMPSLNPTGSKYQTCCGKVICSGCLYAVSKTKKTAIPLCPFCRVLTPTSKLEMFEKEKKRVEAGDAIAINNLGVCHRDGERGYPQNHTKALEYWHMAADLGYAEAYSCIGYAYQYGQGLEVDKKRALYSYKLAAIGGDEVARNNLGNDELRVGNMDRALKHYMLAVRDGNNHTLNVIKQMYTKGDATKEQYTRALQTYQEYLSEIRGPQRDEAAAFSKEMYRYY